MTRFLAVLAATCGLTWSFSVVQTPGGFTVSVDNTLLLTHTPDSPIFYVGQGNLQATEKSGNFLFDDKVYARIPLPAFKLSDNGGIWTVELSQGEVTATLRLSAAGDKDVELSVVSVTSGYTHHWLRITAETEEEIYGAGEQFSFLNLREKVPYKDNIFPIWVNEQGVGRDKRTLTTFFADQQDSAGGDYYTTYFAQPTFISSRKYFCHHDGTNYAVLDFSDANFHEFFVYGPPGKFTFQVSASLTSTVQSVSSFLGSMPDLPDWIQERAIVSVQRGMDNLQAKYNITKQFGVPISAIWIQDWSGQKITSFGDRVFWNWKWDPKHYPGLDQVIQTWAKEGVKVLAYINPNLDADGDLFKEAAAKGYLVKNSTGQVYLRRSVTLIFGQVDLTSPDAYNWYKNVIKTNMIDLGLGGWMADFGEYLATDAVLADGRTGMEAHNEWPALWAKLNREAVEESGKLGEVVFFMRSGFSGTNRYSTLLWNGDQNVDFSLDDGVRSALYGSLGAGMNGATFSHFDIGGYTTSSQFGMVRTRELLLRSAEFAVFTSVFRTHEGNEISSNAQWYDSQITADFATQAKRFQTLTDYRKAVGKASVASGLPTMRMMSLEFPNNPTPLPFDQYMFGSDLLVAPVYLQGATSRQVELPALPGNNHWVHVWSGKPVTGGQSLKVDAPLGQPPVYYRSDSQFVSTFQKLLLPHSSNDGVGTESGQDASGITG